jgi:hypothetical protein
VAVDEVISAEENARDPGHQLAKRGGHERAMAEHAAPCDSGRRTCFSFAVGELGIYISTGLGVALSKPNCHTLRDRIRWVSYAATEATSAAGLAWEIPAHQKG